MIKILAVKYPTSVDFDMKRKVVPKHLVANKQTVQPTINKLLFEEKFNYLLIGMDDNLFICEPLIGNVYSTRHIDYHPSANQLK